MSRKKPKSMENKPNPKPKDDGCKKETTNRHVYIEPGVQIDFVQDLREQYETAQGDDNTHKAAQLLWTKIASGLILLTVAFSASQIWQTRSNFRKDQRPYVWVLDYILPGNIRIAENQKLYVSIAIVNYGKSPALHVRIARKIFVGQDSIQQASRWFDGFKDGTTKYIEGEGLIPPGIPQDPSKAFGYETAFSDDPLTRDNLNYISTTEKSFAVVFRFAYEDSFGGNFWSEACYQRQLNGAMAHCEKHNTADSE
jgi:hypothetical protein